MNKRRWYRLSTNAFSPEQLVVWASAFSHSCVLLSNNYTHDPYSRFEMIAAAGELSRISLTEPAGAVEKLQEFQQQHTDWMFGYLSYDLKNGIEALSSSNPDQTDFPVLEFFVPRIVFKRDKEGLLAGCFEGSIEEHDLSSIVAAIGALPVEQAHFPPVQLNQRITRNEYLEKVGFLKENIQYGNIYEINFCHEMFSEDTSIDPSTVFNHLNQLNPSPFSAFVRSENRYALCSSPERWLCRRGTKLVSQPIKGTSRRGVNNADDHSLAEALRSNVKEQAENVMIVDLVRNDLSRVAAPQSVKVDELFGVYSFPQVHQLISTVSCELRPDAGLSDILRAAFPMGSMTGAPKIKAMELIEQTEARKRGLYSGSIGYISPDGDFDFNVVIRTLLYNAEARYVSVMAGGAVTSASEPEQEYLESLLKMKAMKQALEGRPN